MGAKKNEPLKTAELSEEMPDNKSDNKIITTDEELQAYYIVKSILRKTFPMERITYRAAQTYFSILIDDNNRKTLCRLKLISETNKKIIFLDDDKKEIVYKIDSIDDIYNHADELYKVAEKFR